MEAKGYSEHGWARKIGMARTTLRSMLLREERCMIDVAYQLVMASRDDPVPVEDAASRSLRDRTITFEDMAEKAIEAAG